MSRPAGRGAHELDELDAGPAQEEEGWALGPRGEGKVSKTPPSRSPEARWPGQAPAFSTPTKGAAPPLWGALAGHPAWGTQGAARSLVRHPSDVTLASASGRRVQQTPCMRPPVTRVSLGAGLTRGRGGGACF